LVDWLEEYVRLLDRAYSQLPRGVSTRSGRFEVPRPIVTIAGARTVVQNFKAICDAMNRNPELVLKFLSKELGTAALFDGRRAVFQGKFFEDTIENLIKTFIKEYVICPVCKRPDTHLVKEKRFLFLDCDACGARSSLRPI